MTTATDNFNRAALGANWTNIRNTIAINSSIRVTPGMIGDDCAAFYNATTFTADHASKITLPVMGASTWFGVGVRMAVGENFYCAYTNGSTWEINRFIGGAYTRLLDGGAVFVAGDTITLTAVGTTLTLYKNDIAIASTTDTQLATGQPGLAGFTAATHQTFGDDWIADDVTTPPASAGTSGATTMLLLLRNRK